LYYAVAHLLPQSGKCETCVRVTDSDTKNQKIIPSLRYQQQRKEDFFNVVQGWTLPTRRCGLR
ncbi:hypothetical protein JG687_00010073, partial [Phytophthora cactorum]